MIYYVNEKRVDTKSEFFLIVSTFVSCKSINHGNDTVFYYILFSLVQSPLNPEAMKKAQKESRDKVPAGGFIDLGKFASILSTLLSENVAKIAPKVSWMLT